MKDILIKISSRLGMYKILEYTGNYSSWDEARKKTKGYDADEIFEKVTKSALTVTKGDACYERDSWLYYEKEYNYPLLFHMQNSKGIYRVLDWGGAAASTYFQNRDMLNKMAKQLKWFVIEQPHFASWGEKNLQDENLIFYSNNVKTDEIIKREGINIVLLSAVIHYLDFADALIEQIISSKVEKIIIERTPVGCNERIMIETVREPIYDASYPIHIFEEDELVKKFKGYRMVASWKSLVDEDIMRRKETIATFKSYVFELQ